MSDITLAVRGLSPRELFYLGLVDSVACRCCGNRIWAPMTWMSADVADKGGAPDCYHSVHPGAPAPTGYLVGDTMYCSATCARDAEGPVETRRKGRCGAAYVDGGARARATEPVVRMVDAEDDDSCRRVCFTQEEWERILRTIRDAGDPQLTTLVTPIHNSVLQLSQPEGVIMTIGFEQPTRNMVYAAVRAAATDLGITEKGS